MKIFTRQDWGAEFGRGDHNPGAKPNVVAHHTLAPVLPASATMLEEAAAMRGMDRDHVERNGWDGIGYNFVIFQSGRVYEGRGWGYKGAHAGSKGNGVSEGVAFAVDGRKDTPSAAAIASCRLLIVDGIRAGHLASDYRLSGHRDWMPGRDCPGDAMYRMIQTLRHDEASLIPKVFASPLTATVVPPNLERIIVPGPEHIDEAVRVNPRWTREKVRDGIALVEVLLRGMQAAGVKHAAPKVVADALSTWLRVTDE